MFNKLGHHLGKVKAFIGQGYAHGKRFLGHLDNAYRTGKEIYNIVQPAMRHLAPETTSNVNRHLNKMDSNYNRIGDKVVDTHSKVEHHVNDMAGKFKAKNIHIGM